MIDRRSHPPLFVRNVGLKGCRPTPEMSRGAGRSFGLSPRHSPGRPQYTQLRRRLHLVVMPHAPTSVSSDSVESPWTSPCDAIRRLLRFPRSSGGQGSSERRARPVDPSCRSSLVPGGGLPTSPHGGFRNRAESDSIIEVFPCFGSPEVEQLRSPATMVRDSIA